MARINLLKPRQIATFPTGFHSDGSNLYLRVSGSNARSWVFRYMRNGKVKQIGIGTTIERLLTDARKLEDKLRTALADGEDPAAILARRDPESMTFSRYAEELIEAKARHFRSAKHTVQWLSSLKRYAYPTIGDKRIGSIQLSTSSAPCACTIQLAKPGLASATEGYRRRQAGGR